MQYYDVAVDAKYQFIKGVVGAYGCEKLLYMNHNFKFVQDKIGVVAEIMDKMGAF